ncbi:DUF1028 domain-containing protein [Deinococcus peraridilitoris]|uniref:DUF1028 domain-containing protein n=1 Tax=Deinococcus peraridilitoris (strain DSM 19664 / LMG 22246 / CIP 109416 / KR-200) TaxID=937777 RepID=K9ZXF5_DEIPD|nr:DUF1028 domain-containing protein [Deinococcus peraridilitoris]AFZ66261.1 hypothetical protein Deipe_0676 [Deinococcus peraridilitoris DSM 19664]
MVKLNTFSITARCAQTGQLGVAVSTAVPGVGMLCPFVQAEVGAVASQSFVNPYLGIWGLEYLADGHSASETLELLKQRDQGLALRQFAIVDRHGGSAAFSGDGCDGWYGHLTGPDYAIAGNMLVGAETLNAMKDSFERSEHRPLVERLLEALQAGQNAGGDKRGKQSAAVKVYSTEQYPLVDLRVDEHTDPVPELQRVYDVARETLLPLIGMLPSKAHPQGLFNMEESRKRGLLQDH